MADGSQHGAEIQTALYRHFDAGGRLLYIGISLSPTYRLAQHRGCSAWFRDIASVTIQWFPDRPAALDAEREAIRAENPEFNTVHKLTFFEESAAEQAEESCATLARKVSRFGTCYRAADAAKAIGIQTAHMRLAMAAGDVPYYSNGQHTLISGWAVIGYLEALEAGAARVRRQERQDNGALRRPPTEGWLAANDGQASIEAWYEYEAANYEPLAAPPAKG